MHLQRPGLLEQLEQFVTIANGVLVGAPGVGKTFLLKTFCTQLLDSGVPSLYLPIDKLGANSEADLQAELGIPMNLADYLASQQCPPGAKPVLAIDSFDAARSELAQQFVLGLVRRAKEELDQRWRIIVSVRSYDAEKCVALQRLFPDTDGSTSSRLQHPNVRCRHFVVDRLSVEEVETAIQTIPALPAVYSAAAAEFRGLMRIPFNLWLAERLLFEAGTSVELTTVNSEVQLLELFWKHRVLEVPSATDLSVLLTRVTREMVMQRSLAIRVADVYPVGAVWAWDALLSAEILDTLQPQGKRVSFAHNILFDYAVAVLLIEEEPAAACAFLADDPSRPLFLRPSVDYFFTRLWHANPRTFFAVLWYMLAAAEDHVRMYARLVPAVVMGREAKDITQFVPLLERVASGEGIGATALLHLLQAVRGLFRGQRDPMWAELLRRAAQWIQVEFAWQIGALAFEVLDRAATAKHAGTIDACSEVGRRLLHWVFANRAQEANAFLDNLGAVWGVGLVARTFGREPEGARSLLQPILKRLGEQQFPLEYFRRLTDEVQNIWPTDPEFAIEIYVAAFSYDEHSDEKTSFGTPILPLTSTRRQDFAMCQYHLIHRYRDFLDGAPQAATRAAVRALNQYVIDREVLRFLNPGFQLSDLTETFDFRGRSAAYVRDLSYIWDASMHRDEPAQIADHLFTRIETAATNGETDLIDDVLDIFADEARIAFLWKRLLKTGSQAPAIFAPRLFPLVLADAILQNSETLEAAGSFLEAASRELTEDQRARIETRIIELAETQSDSETEEKKEARVDSRDRLISCLPSNLLVTARAKVIREELERRGAVRENRPLVEFSVGTRAFSEEDWLREAGADPARVENRSLIDITDPLEKFTSEFRNKRPDPAAITAILPLLQQAFGAVQDSGGVDNATQYLAFTRVASVAEAVARGIVTPECMEFALSKRILLAALPFDPPPESTKPDESYEVPYWSPSPTTEAAQGLPWLARQRPDADLLEGIQALSRDPRHSVRYLTVRASFRIFQVAQDVYWHLSEDRAQNERSGAVQDALCHSISQVLRSEESRAVSVLSLLAERLLSTDVDSEALRSLTAIAMWLGVARENGWAIEYLSKLIEDPEHFSHALGYGTLEASNYVQPGAMGTEREPWLHRALAWLSSAIDASVSSSWRIRSTSTLPLTEESTELLKRLYGVIDQTVTKLHFALDPKYASDKADGPKTIEKQRTAFYWRVKPLLEQVAKLAGHSGQGVLFAPTAHHFIELLQQTVDYDPAGTLYLAAAVASASEITGYNLDSLAAKETVELAERILADHRSVLRQPQALSDMLKLLDLFAKVGWPDALRLLWRLDEIFR
jgi:hypothetical protein